MRATFVALGDSQRGCGALTAHSGLTTGQNLSRACHRVEHPGQKSASRRRAGIIPARNCNVVPRRFSRGDSRVDSTGSYFQLLKISQERLGKVCDGQISLCAAAAHSVQGYGIRRTQARHPTDVLRHATDATTASGGRVHGIRRTRHSFISLIQ